MILVMETRYIEFLRVIRRWCEHKDNLELQQHRQRRIDLPVLQVKWNGMVLTAATVWASCKAMMRATVGSTGET